MKYTYADYLGWADGERWELIDGVAYNMSPAPSRTHQKISKRLLVQLEVHLRGKKCEVCDAPSDERVTVGILPELEIDLAMVFAE